MLVKYGASRVTLHHNIFIGNASRNPQARIDDAGGRATETTLDMRHNLVWDFSGYGTLIWEGAWANVAHNYYGTSRNAIAVETARAWVQGNRAADGRAIDHAGTESAPFDAPAVDGADACDSARAALAGAGVRPLDAIDHLRLATVDLGDCPGTVPAPAPVEPPVALDPEPGQPGGGPDAPPPAADPGTEGHAWREVEVAVSTGADDGNEDANGTVWLARPLLRSGAGAIAAFRFAGVPVPARARIRSATLWTVALLEGTRPIAVRYTGEATADSPQFVSVRHDLSRRPRTRAAVVDTPGPWPPLAYTSSPELAAIVQEIVDQPGWESGNGLTLFVDDHGSRTRRRVAGFENPVLGAAGAVLLIRYEE
jgi:hypothetical protein